MGFETEPKARVSIVVPVFEEAENIGPLCEAIWREVTTITDVKFEIIFIDDGSRDGTWDRIQDMHSLDERIRGVRFSRNFGHQAALTAGYRLAAGDAVITMDGDLQHPPELLPAMIEKWREGCDVVSMVREQSADLGWFKKRSSAAFYRCMNTLSDVPIKESVADFRLLDRRVVRRLNAMRERSRFLRGLISWIGFREVEIRYTVARRLAGRTKYSLSKMIGLATNAISSFSTFPLKLGFYAGMIVNFFCVGLMGYAIYNKLHENKDLTEWASTFMTMLFLSGMQLLMIGVIGLYLGRVLEEVKGRPVYVVNEKLGFTRRRRERRWPVEEDRKDVFPA